MSFPTSDGPSNGKPAPASSMQTISINGKGSAAPPQTTTDGVELKNMTVDNHKNSNGNGKSNGNVARSEENSRPQLPVESDIMQLARLGEIGAMQKLFDTKKFNAKYKDEEGITPLHVSEKFLYIFVASYVVRWLIRVFLVLVGGNQ